MKKIDIKGKEYVPVNERLLYFNEHYPGWAILTSIEKMEDKLVLIKATILDDKDRVRAVAHAYEKEGNSFINSTSYIENCETSAVGRALGFLGIGIDTSIASFEEVANAMTQQQARPGAMVKPILNDTQVKELQTLIKWAGFTDEDIKKKYKVKKLSDLTPRVYKAITQSLSKYISEQERGSNE